MPIKTVLKLRHCWGFPDSAIPDDLGDPIKSFPNQDEAQGTLGDVCLHKREGGAYPSLWVSYPRFSHRPEDNEDLIREVCPLDAGWTVERWGKAEKVWCHTKDPSHPWNRGVNLPGYHRCGACGYPTWIEFHGVADGCCERCGYHG